MGGKVATGVYFVPHIKRGVLRIAQIFLGVAVVNALGEVFLVAGVCPYCLALFADDCRRAGILAERELSLGGNLRVAKHCESHAFIVVGSLRVFEYCRNKL